MGVASIDHLRVADHPPFGPPKGGEPSLWAMGCFGHLHVAKWGWPKARNHDPQRISGWLSHSLAESTPQFFFLFFWVLIFFLFNFFKEDFLEKFRGEFILKTHVRFISVKKDGLK
jgi:hypothetical protein